MLITSQYSLSRVKQLYKSLLAYNKQILPWDLQREFPHAAFVQYVFRSLLRDRYYTRGAQSAAQEVLCSSCKTDTITHPYCHHCRNIDVKLKPGAEAASIVTGNQDFLLTAQESVHTFMHQVMLSAKSYSVEQIEEIYVSLTPSLPWLRIEAFSPNNANHVLHMLRKLAYMHNPVLLLCHSCSSAPGLGQLVPVCDQCPINIVSKNASIWSLCWNSANKYKIIMPTQLHYLINTTLIQPQQGLALLSLDRNTVANRYASLGTPSSPVIRRPPSYNTDLLDPLPGYASEAPPPAYAPWQPALNFTWVVFPRYDEIAARITEGVGAPSSYGTL